MNSRIHWTHHVERIEPCHISQQMIYTQRKKSHWIPKTTVEWTSYSIGGCNGPKGTNLAAAYDDHLIMTALFVLLVAAIRWYNGQNVKHFSRLNIERF